MATKEKRFISSSKRKAYISLVRGNSVVVIKDIDPYIAYHIVIKIKNGEFWVTVRTKRKYLPLDTCLQKELVFDEWDDFKVIIHSIKPFDDPIGKIEGNYVVTYSYNIDKGVKSRISLPVVM